jgi:hypothetical protein
MRIKTLAFTTVAILALGNAGRLIGQSGPAEKMFSCDTISLARPGEGVAYRDGFTNDDYHFSATIPPGLTAWGAAPDAPFHGFTILLDTRSSKTSCIHLVVGMRVDLPEDPPSNSNHKGATSVKVGNRVGLQKVTRGIVHGVSFENLRISLDLPHSGYQNNVIITLVTPTGATGVTLPIFKRFISQIRFWGAAEPRTDERVVEFH